MGQRDFAAGAREPSRRWRVSFSLGPILLYILFFIPLYDTTWIARSVIAFSLIPIGMTAYAFGVRGSAVVALLFIPLNLSLFLLAGEANLSAFANRNFWFSHAGFLAVGLVVGSMREMHWRLAHELAARQQLKDDLGQSEQRYQELFDTVPVALYQIAPDGRILECNRYAVQLFGYADREVAMRNNAIELYQDKTVREEWLRQMGREGKVRDFRVPMRHRDGSSIWLQRNDQAVRGRDGKLLYYNGSAVDITNLVQAEEALRHRATQLILLNDISREIASVLQLDRLLERAARLVKEAFSFHQVVILTYESESQDLVLRARYGDFGVVDLSDFRVSLDKGLVGWAASERKTVLVNDVRSNPRYINPDNTPVLSELAVPIRLMDQLFGVLDIQSKHLDAFDENDALVMETMAGQLAVAIQNTRLFEEVEQLGAFSEGIIRTVPGAIVMTDAAGVITFANPAAGQLLAYSQEQLQGSHSSMMFPDDQWPIVEAVDRRRALGESSSYAVDLLRSDHLRIPVLISGSPRFEGERYAGSVAFIANITEQAQVQQLLRQQKEQLDSLRQVGLKVAAQLDLDTLLQSIIDRALELVDGESGALYLYRPEREVLECVCKAGWAPMPLGFELHRGEGLSGQVWQIGKPLIVEDYRDWDGRVFEFNEQRTVMGVPIFLGDVDAPESFVGVLNLTISLPRSFSSSDAELLNLFASQVAVAIRNARLYERAEQERDRAQRYLDVAGAIIVALDPRQQVTLINRQGCAVLGMAVDDILGKNWFDAFVPTEQRELLRAGFARMLAGEVESYEFAENPILTADGELRLIAWHHTLLRDEAGGIIGTLSSGTDITEERHAEEALRQSEQLYRLLAENVTDVIWTIDQRGRFTYVSPSVERLRGFTPQEVLTQSLADALTPNSLEIAQDALRRLWNLVEAGGAFAMPELFHLEQSCKDGSTVWTEVIAGGLQDQHGGFAGVLGVSRDLTERHRMNQVLARRAAQLALLSDVGGKIASMLDLNELLERVAGLIQAHFGYQHVALFVMDSDQAVVTRAITSVFVDGVRPPLRLAFGEGMVGWTAAHRQTLLSNDVNSEERYVNPWSLPTASELSVPICVGEETFGVLDIQSSEQEAFDENDVLVMEALADQIAIGIQNAQLYQKAQDEIVERLRVESALRQSNQQLTETLDELQQAQERLVQQERMAAVGQLSAGLAHEYNNLMSSVVLFGDMLLQSPNLSELERSRVEAIRRQGTRATELTQQMLDFGLKTVLEPRQLDLIPLVRHLAVQLQGTLPANIHTYVSFSGGEFRVRADRMRLQQAIINLALNARDAMPDGGELRLAVTHHSGEVNCAACGETASGEWVQISVSDTGMGISEAIRPHIFEPFFTTRAPLGSGLGLSQVFGIVRQHDGHLGLESSRGKGSTFFIYLPVLPAGGQDLVITGEVEGFGRRILLVENDPGVRHVLQMALEMLGYKVLHASSAEETLALLDQQAGEVDLVLADIRLQDMSGLDLANAIAQREAAVAVVLMSGPPMDERQVEKVGVVGWLEKPINLSRLRDVLAQALQADVD